MAVKTYALVATASGALVRRQEFDDGQQPTLSAAKGLRWIEDSPPDYDPGRQRLVVTTPIPEEASEVPYTVETDPSHSERVAKRNSEQITIRSVQELRAKGDITSRIEALELIIKERNIWP